MAPAAPSTDAVWSPASASATIVEPKGPVAPSTPPPPHTPPTRVRDLYDSFRSAKFNFYYWGARLDAVRKRNLGIEIAIAVAAPGSAVATLTLWSHSWGKTIWAIVALIAAFLAVVKPILGLARRIETYQQVATSYRSLAIDLQEIVQGVRQRGLFDESLQHDFDIALKKLGRLTDNEPVESINEKLRRQMYDKVNREWPKDSFFVPEGA